jgi:polyferredoxin
VSTTLKVASIAMKVFVCFFLCPITLFQKNNFATEAKKIRDYQNIKKNHSMIKERAKSITH